MMRIKPKEVTDTVTLLVDPQPKAMALVDHGANQTPWNVVKHAKRKKGNDMPKGKGAKRVGKLTAMRFSKAKFTTKKSVRDYLKKNNIEDAGVVQDEDDVWLVESTEDLSAVKLGKARSVPGKDAGVTAFIADVIGKAAEADEDDENDEEDDEQDETLKSDGDEDDDENDEDEGEEEDEEDETKSDKKAGSKVKIVREPETKGAKPKPAPKGKAKKAAKVEPVFMFANPELVEKYDWWGSYTSDEDSLLGVLADGMSYDNVPPGMEEVVMGCYYTIGNIFSDDNTPEERKAKLAQMGQELAQLAYGLGELFTKAVEDATKAVSGKTRKAAAQFVEDFSASVDAAAEGDTSLFENVFKAEADEDEDEENEKPKAKKSSRKTKDDVTDLGKIVEAAVGKATKGLRDEVAALKDANAELSEELGRAPTRRSMSDAIEDLVEEDEDDEATKTEKATALDFARMALGGRPVR